MIAYEYAAVGCGFVIRKTGRRSPIVEIQLSAQLGLVYSISKPAFFFFFSPTSLPYISPQKKWVWTTKGADFALIRNTITHRRTDSVSQGLSPRHNKVTHLFPLLPVRCVCASSTQLAFHLHAEIRSARQETSLTLSLRCCSTGKYLIYSGVRRDINELPDRIAHTHHINTPFCSDKWESSSTCDARFFHHPFNSLRDH